MKKFSLRVSGARIGSVVRPVLEGADPIAIEIAPAQRLGLRVHASRLAPVVVAQARALDANDYASLDDYKDTP